MYLRSALATCLSLALIITVCPVLAQDVPESITYQGRLTDSAGRPLSGSHTMCFRLLDSLGGGTMLWDSGDMTVLVENGLFTVILGTTANRIDSAKLPHGDIWIETSVDGVVLPRAKLASSPFTLRAGDLSLPFKKQIEDSGTAFSLTNAGAGLAADFASFGSAGALRAKMLGAGGYAGHFEVTETTSSAICVDALAKGTGSAGVFGIQNTSSSANAIHAATNGGGSAFYGSSTGTGNTVYGYNNGTGGSAGYFVVDNAANPSVAVVARADGAGDAVWASAQGTGHGVNADAGNGDAVNAATTGSGTGVRSIASGTGRAGHFEITNTGSTREALYVTTNATGEAGHFQITNPANANSAVYAATEGDGHAVYGSTSGKGHALEVHTSGTGNAGYFAIGNPSSAAEAVEGSTNGTGDAISGSSSGSGNAVYGYNSGTGNAPILFGSPIQIRACYDTATVGDNVRIRTKEGENLLRSSFPCIRITNAGALRIY